MQRNRSSWKHGPSRPTKVSCGCGGVSKLRSRTNWPFGQNSYPRKTSYFKCSSCGKENLLIKHAGGKR